jgi:hypothetical protein
MSPYRVALIGGLLYGLPWAAWIVGGLAPSPNTGRDLSAIALSLPLVQLTALVLLLPGLLDDRLGNGLAAALLTLMIPWPILPVLHAAGVGNGLLLLGQATSIFGGLLLAFLYRVLRRAARFSAEAGFAGTLQLAVLLAVVVYGPAMLGMAR